jgi:hypothetical protein
MPESWSNTPPKSTFRLEGVHRALIKKLLAEGDRRDYLQASDKSKNATSHVLNSCEEVGENVIETEGADGGEDSAVGAGEGRTDGLCRTNGCQGCERVI